MSDLFGDRMKDYERRETCRKFMSGIPVYARIDGRTFSKFTKGMDRPYDLMMTRAMIDTTKYLVDQTNALIGYTQSDEISLCWLSESSNQQIFFNGKIQKMVSVLAALATAKFNNIAMSVWPDRIAKTLPVFDTRVFQLPNKIECTNAFLWREFDAIKNSISMAARSVFSHKQLQNKNGDDMKEMLLEKGINWNDYPSFFKRGTYVQRKTKLVKMDNKLLKKIPEKHRPNNDLVRRSEVIELDMPPFVDVLNRVEVIFNNEEPISKEILN